MRVSFVSVALCFAVGTVLSNPVPDDDHGKKSVPAACASPKPVSKGYELLSRLRATAFCTSWLGITTVIVSTTQTNTITTSVTATVTSVPVQEVVATEMTTTDTTTTVTETATAPAITSITTIPTTLFTPTTSTSTSTSTSHSTTTFYDFHVSKKKAKRQAKPAKPSKLHELHDVADGIVSSACSCIASTPTSTVQVTTSSTLTVSFDTTVTSTATSTVSTLTQVDTNVLIETSSTTTTPTTTITSIATLTAPTIVATSTTTKTVTQVDIKFVAVDLIAIQFDGNLPITFNAKFANIGGGTPAAAASNCYLRCVAFGRGSTQCDEVFIAQVLATNTFDCYLLSQAQEANSNFHRDAGIGFSAEYIIIEI